MKTYLQMVVFQWIFLISVLIANEGLNIAQCCLMGYSYNIQLSWLMQMMQVIAGCMVI